MPGIKYPEGYKIKIDVIPREVLIYKTANEKCPLEDWLNGLSDVVARAAIRKRINRVRVGNLGANCSLGDGVEFTVALGRTKLIN